MTYVIVWPDFLDPPPPQLPGPCDHHGEKMAHTYRVKGSKRQRVGVDTDQRGHCPMYILGSPHTVFQVFSTNNFPQELCSALVIVGPVWICFYQKASSSK